MSEKRSKAVVMLGGFGHEGFSTTVKTLGYELISLNLNKVTPKTWLKRADVIYDLKNSDRLAATVIYLHTNLLLEASKSQYRDAFMQILQNAQSSKILIFVFQDNLDGIFSMRDWETREILTLDTLQTIYETSSSGRMRVEDALSRLRDYLNRKDEVTSFLGAIYLGFLPNRHISH
jgi:hypothetical protein